MKSTVWRALLAAIVALSITVPLAAQDISKETPKETGQQPAEPSKEPARVQEKIVVTSRYVPEESTTATKIAVDPLLIPASISSVSGTLLQEQNASVLFDALNNIAGVTTNRDSGLIEAFVLRGFDSTSSGLLLMNGAYEPRTGVSETYNVDRLEVVRGPIGFLYGGNAMAGAVNLVRKEPLPQEFARVEMLGGSYGTGRTAVDLNQANADSTILFRLNGMWQSSDGYRDRQPLEVYAVNPSLTFNLSDRTSLNFDLEGQQTNATLDMGIPIVAGEIPDVPRQTNYGTPFDEAEQKTARVQVNLKSALSATRTLHNKIYYTDQKWTDAGAVLGATIPTLPGDAMLIRAFGDLEQKVKVFGDQFDVAFQLGSGPVRHDLVVGAEVQQLKVNSTVQIGMLPPIMLQNPIETAQEPVTYIPGAGFGVDLNIRTAAPYVLEVLHLQDRWHLSAGGRLDWIDQKNGILGQSNKETDFSPFLGVLYAQSSELSLYANYGEGFNPISLGVVNADPKPEKSRGAEVGAKTQLLAGRVRASASFYQLKKENIAIVDGTGFVAQIGDQQSKGFELEASASPVPLVDVLVAYGYTDAEMTRFARLDTVTGVVHDYSGNAPTWAPKHVANGWISKRFQNGFGVGGGLRYVGQRFVDEANLVKADPYTTLNATLFLERGRWATTLYLNNLTNARYETRAFDAVIPAPERNASLGIRFRL